MQTENLNPKEAAKLTMEQVSSAVVATTLVLLAIFVPIAFMSGITGKIYQQFSVTICVAVCFSTFCALTLAPAIASHFFKKSEPSHLTPLIWFNRLVQKSTNATQKCVLLLARKLLIIGLIFVAACGLAFVMFRTVNTSFLPNEDQGMVIISASLPEGATLGRTNEVMHKVMPIVLKEPGVKNFVVIEGMSLLMGSGENVASGIVGLKPWDDRTQGLLQRLWYSVPFVSRPRDDSSTEILKRLTRELQKIPEAEFQLIEMPAIPGLGTSGDLSLYVQDLEDLNYTSLDNNVTQFTEAITAHPDFQYGFSSFTSKTPNVFLEIDRDKAESMGVPMANIFTALENYLGSGYVNDVNFGTQVNKVIVQSDWKYRRNLQSLDKLYVPNAIGQMVPLKALLNIKQTLAPRQITRYNQYPAASVSIRPNDQISSGAAMDSIETLAAQVLPKMYAYEWSGMSYQEKQNAGQVGYLVLLATIFAYLFLVAQYESWVVPVPVLMSVIFAIVGGLLGLMMTSLPMSIYAQLGLVLLIGLASKNAILMVEFSKDEHNKGMPVVEAGVQGLVQRFRAVLMTAFTFILGVLPMLWATGAASGSRRSLGTPVFWGMLWGTILGLVFTPLFYILIQSFVDRLFHRKKSK